MKKLLLSVLVFTFTSNAYAYIKIRQSIFCPPLVNNTCPSGFKLKKEGLSYIECINDKKEICIYPKEIEKENLFNVKVELSPISNALKNTNMTIDEYFLRLATLDPSVYEKRKDSLVLSYFYDVGVYLSSAFYKLSFVLFLLIFLIASASKVYEGTLASLERKEGDFALRKLEELKDTFAFKFAPYMMFVLVSLVPMKNEYSVYEPILLNTLRQIFISSLKFSDNLVNNLNEMYIDKKLSLIVLNLNKVREKIKLKVKTLDERLDELEQILSECQREYSTKSFFLDEDALTSLVCQNPPCKYTIRTCINTQKEYEDLLTKRNSLAIFYNNLEKRDYSLKESMLANIEKNIDKYLYDDSIEGDIARFVYYSKQLGILSFPITTLSDLAIKGIAEKDFIGKEKGFFASTLEGVFRASVFLSMPPGKNIYSFFLNIEKNIANAFMPKEQQSASSSSLLGKVVDGILSITLGAEYKVAKAAFSALYKIGALSAQFFLAYVAYKIAYYLLLSLPIFLVTLAFIYRFVAYIINVFKIILSSFLLAIFVPFPNLFKEHFNTFAYNVFYYALYPNLLVLGGFLSVFTLFIGYNLMDLVVDVFSSSMSIYVSKLSSIGVIRYAVKYPLAGFFTYVFLLFLSYVSFRVMMVSPDKIADILGLRRVRISEEDEIERVTSRFKI